MKIRKPSFLLPNTLVCLFMAYMLLFALQKIYFICHTNPDIGLAEASKVIWHGIAMDAAVSGYILAVPLLVLLAGAWLSQKWIDRLLKPYFAIIAVIVAVITVTDAALYPFWKFKLDASVFLYTDKPKDALASVSFWYVARRALVAFGLAILTYNIPAQILKKYKDIRNASISRRIQHVVCHIALAFVLFLFIRGGLGKGTLNVSSVYFSENQYLNHAAVNPVFNLMYSMGKLEDFASKYQFYSDEELAEIMQGIYHTESIDQDILLNTERPDILLIILEGCGYAITETEGVTPNICREMAEGVNFTQCFAASFRTDRGQVALLSGMPAIPKISLNKYTNKCEKLPGLPRHLFNEGYKTTFYYGGDILFANTGGYMHQAGFTTTVSEKDFPTKEERTEWGVYDGTLLNRATDNILNDKSSTPRFDCVMTLSSHEPWIVPTNRIEDEKLNAFNYTDECIGILLDRLRKSDRWKNMLVIITADHGVMIDDEHMIFDSHITHLPMIWTGGAVKGHRNMDKLMSQTDLAATLLSQLGIDHKDFLFSRDVASSSYIYPTTYFAYNAGVSFSDSTGHTFYDTDGGKTIMGIDSTRERKAKAVLQTISNTIAIL